MSKVFLYKYNIFSFLLSQAILYSFFKNFDFLNQSQWQEKGVNGNLLFSKRNFAHLLKARDSISDEIFHSILL